MHILKWAWYRIQTKMMFLSTSKTKRVCVWNSFIWIFGEKIVMHVSTREVHFGKRDSAAFRCLKILLSCLLPFYVNIMCLFSFSFLLLWRKKNTLKKKNVYTLRDDSSNIIKFTSFITSTIIIVLVCWLIIALMSGKQLWFIVIFSKSYNLFFVK